jgi:hypothetical protein
MGLVMSDSKYSRWRKTEEKIPEKNQTVLTVAILDNGEPEYSIARYYFCDDMFRNSNGEIVPATHWRHLPKPLKELK